MTFVISMIAAFIIAIGGFLYYFDAPTSAPKAETPAETKTNATPGGAATSLTTVDRSGQNLTKMPADILSMTNVQHLDLSNNALSGALLAEIRRLSNLQILNISNNAMTGLPAELGQLSQLRVLNAANNNLTGLPYELGNLQNLEVLDLSGNDISQTDLEVIRAKLPASTEIIL